MAHEAETREAYIIEFILLLCGLRNFTDGSAKNMGSPSRIVAQFVRDNYEHWLSTPGKKGQQRKGGDLRRFLPKYEPLPVYQHGWLDPYFENWSSLEAASKSPEPSL
jgi:hypothetical protein